MHTRILRKFVLFVLAGFCLLFLAVAVTKYVNTSDGYAQIEHRLELAKLDRIDREERLLNGQDSVSDAMNRFAEHDFLDIERLGVSGWIMTTEVGVDFHRATLRRQADLICTVGEPAVPELVKWLSHDQNGNSIHCCILVIQNY